MKEMAYSALAIAFIGLVMMFAGVIYESNWRAMDCDDDSWLAQNGYSSSSSNVQASDIEKCETDSENTYNTADVLQSGGYPIILFAIVLMIGVNRLQE